MSKINLVIKQNSTNVEQATSTTIDKLYNLAYESEATGTESKISSTADDIVGTINAPSAYQDAVDYLRNKFPNLTITVTDGNYYIRFEDEKVLNKLLQAGYGDGTGITITQAATTDFGQLFRGNVDITSFDELKYFPQTYTFCMFAWNQNIESTDLTNITSVRQWMVAGCKKLKYFNGKNNAPNTVYLPKLTSVENSGGFADCSLLYYVTSLGYITTTQAEMFKNCSNLEDVVLPNTCKTINTQTFYGCTALKEVILPSSVTAINSKAFYNCSNLTNITCLSETPPTLASTDAFQGTACVFYVPISSIDAYKAAENWSDYADRIQAIPTE